MNRVTAALLESRMSWPGVYGNEMVGAGAAADGSRGSSVAGAEAGTARRVRVGERLACDPLGWRVAPRFERLGLPRPRHAARLRFPRARRVRGRTSCVQLRGPGQLRILVSYSWRRAA